MKSNKEKMIEAFNAVKKLGYVKSNRKNNTGIGKTFEDYVGVIENNIDEADLYGFEIKSHREEAASYITLFTKAPTFPPGANAYLKDKYGIPYENNQSLKKLHTSMFANRYNTSNGNFSFRLINDGKGFIKIGVYDIDSKQLLDNNVGYTYDSIETILHKKLKSLFYVSAKREYRGDDEYFSFYKAEIYSNPSLAKFLHLLDDGKIMYDIRIGSYKSGSNFGKAHDHGSGFRILEPNLRLLYEDYEAIE